MSKRDVVAMVVLGFGVVVVGFGCVVTYGLLREYADVCGDIPVLEQVWSGGAGLGPLVAIVAVAFALVVAAIGRRTMGFATVSLVALAMVGATASGAAGIAGKKTAYEDNPATYGGCGGYNS
jgi:hypothetical protein